MLAPSGILWLGLTSSLTVTMSLPQGFDSSLLLLAQNPKSLERQVNYFRIESQLLLESHF